MNNYKSIFMNKPVLPKRMEFDRRIDKIWEKDYHTNNGPMLKGFINMKILEFIE